MLSPLRHLSLTAKAKLLVGLTAAAAMAAVVPAITSAFAAPGPAPAPPTITSGPSGVTVPSTVTFTYSHPQNVTFKCSLDGADYKTCSGSGITYTGLQSGTHTFRVTAQTSGSNPSAPATRTWTIDRNAPAITVAFPTPTGAYKTSAWNSGCATPGICGTATDFSGVQSVSVAIHQAASNKYWNGSSFSSSTQVFQQASGTTSWGYALPVQADGSYTVTVRATDSLGTMTAISNAKVVAYSLDNVAPTQPVLTKAPDNPTFDTSAQFQYDSTGETGFLCSLDGATASACAGNGIHYKDIDTTDHCFNVWAVDKAGNQSAPASHCWLVVLKKNFEISGTVAQPFSPGATRLVDLVISNPFNFDIKVVDVAITVNSVSTDGQPNPACSASDNLVTARAFNGTVIVPKNATRSLSSLGVPEAQWPMLEMPNLPVSQNACKSSTFHFSYTGTATKP
jgi:hypothetical protein